MPIHRDSGFVQQVMYKPPLRSRTCAGLNFGQGNGHCLTKTRPARASSVKRNTQVTRNPGSDLPSAPRAPPSPLRGKVTAKGRDRSASLQAAKSQRTPNVGEASFL